jgi:hypothetical protein
VVQGCSCEEGSGEGEWRVVVAAVSRSVGIRKGLRCADQITDSMETSDEFHVFMVGQLLKCTI